MTITCPLCQSAALSIVTKVPKLTVYKCRECSTTFSVEPNPRHPATEREISY